MEINKLGITFVSHKQKQMLLETTVLHYRNFIEGYYSVELREKNKLIGYDINFINDKKMEFAHKDFIGELTFGKYAIKSKALEKISQKILKYSEIPHKIIMIELGSIFILNPQFTQNLLKLFSTDKKIIILTPKNKEITQTIKNLDDSFMIELNKKETHAVKKAIDKWLGELVSRMEINE